ncbi:transglycosylase domain-containing protein [Salipiger sp. PrR002]|uniref:transglycosylase domain-containing protein n=1 Tax=Salipiger sp. PrR002 TaxID=2706489 RepID=UPI0013BC4B9E|nr:PBP1A family penicillin-binding protein [Salipiger sp. PrR002]NDV99036.1 PBP1A family penicillin-binding protein [Salipiger sp. PrR002]NDW55989.1 PBP1A family penicillin-binding protein [Salipiger sp. PrR004]
MSDSGRGKGRLVADRRYPRASQKSTTKPQGRKVSGGGAGGGGPSGPRKTARKPARKPAKKRNFLVAFVLGTFSWILRIFWRITWRVTAVVALMLALGVGFFYTKLPPVTDLLDGRARGSVTLIDRNGAIFAWRGDQFGGAVTASSVSKHLKNAVIATEDKRFYHHFGVSPRGVASAIRINLAEGRGPLSGHGGSTITQQTAKLLCIGVEYDSEVWKTEADYVADCRESSLLRKGKEALYAMAMELKYTKDEILSIYLNRAYMGGGAYGAEAAAERYFGKNAATLNPQESAMLAGLLTAPSSLAPTNDLERSQARAATVLRLMEDQGYLSDAEEKAAQASPATLSEEAQRKTGGYFADWVMSTGPEYFTRDTMEDVVIRTTLDPKLQQAAEDAMNSVYESKVKEGSKAQAAIVVMSSDGAVRAMVGGRKTGVSGVFNRATQAKRQTGSAFKPFVYATALELGYSPYDTVVDEPFCMNVPGSGQWCPQNYSKTYKGSVTLTTALAHSLNIPAVKISEAVGRDLVHKVASDFGIKSELNDGPAMALGTSEASLLEMSGAYAGILNGGSAVTPYGLVDLRLKGEDEVLMGTGGGIRERVIQPEAAGQLVWMMEHVVSEGTGRRAQLPDREVAGKTGTSNDARDAWFIGFTSDYVVGVWMGNDDNSPLTGVTGGGLPAEIWRETMLRVTDGTEAKPLPAIAPAAPEPAQPQVQQRQPERQRRDNIIQQVIRDLLGGG